MEYYELTPSAPDPATTVAEAMSGEALGLAQPVSGDARAILRDPAPAAQLAAIAAALPRCYDDLSPELIAEALYAAGVRMAAP